MARIKPTSSGGSLPSDVSFADFIQIWNQEQGQTTPRLHLTMSTWLMDNWRKGERELLLMAFRNAGKSTLVGLFANWLLLADPNRRILVLSADHALARRMVRNVKRITEQHPWTGALKPLKADEWASDRFTMERDQELRDPSMLARGIGGNITGSRADVVICDDVEVPKTCDTPGKRADLRDRLDEIEYVLTPDGLKLFIGTPHTLNSIYAAETGFSNDGEAKPYLAGYQRLELPILNEAGNSQWPERFSLERIDTLRKRSGPQKFQSQMLLRPTALENGRLNPDRLVPYAAELDYREAGGEAVLRLGTQRLISASCWWDPAYGAPGRGDASVVAVVFTDEDGNYRLHDIRYLAHDPALLDCVDEATQQCRQVADFARENHLPQVTIEKNGIGRFLPGLLRGVFRDLGLPVAVTGLPSTRAKDLRILDAFDARLAATRLYAHERVFSSPFIMEMREWRPAINARDDGLDAVAGCLLSEPVLLPQLPDYSVPDRPPAWRGHGNPVIVSSDFSP